MSERIDLGNGHVAEWEEHNGDPRAGLYHYHPCGDRAGACAGWITIADGAWEREFAVGEIPTWTIEALEPLTLSPSLLCRSCGSHGFIQSGKWVKA